MKKTLLIFAVVLFASTAIFADIARPNNSSNRVEKPKSTIDSNLTIRMDRNAKEAKLIIPRSQLRELRAELEQLDNELDDSAAATGGISRTQTIMSGLFLSLALVFGGVWFVRSGRSPKSAAIIVVLLGIGTAATFVFANAGPPPEARAITSKLFDMKVFTPYRFASGKIKIEVSDDNNSVQLIVPDLTPAPTGEE